MLRLQPRRLGRNVADFLRRGLGTLPAALLARLRDRFLGPVFATEPIG